LRGNTRCGAGGSSTSGGRERFPQWAGDRMVFLPGFAILPQLMRLFAVYAANGRSLKKIRR
ncbi:MAG TPA: hypothetical protein VF278_02145, partial [Pirellulales bacterium]